VTHAFQSGQAIKAVISHTEEKLAVQSGTDASKVKKYFSVREDWVGRVLYINGEEYAFEFKSHSGAA
jgi:hypothetical protein